MKTMITNRGRNAVEKALIKTAFVVAMIALAFALASLYVAIQERKASVKWFKGTMIIHDGTNSATVRIGFRNDGKVVWEYKK